jgi:hypothetical protein
MICEKKKILWCDDPPEDRVISIVAGCLANHDRAHSPLDFFLKRNLFYHKTIKEEKNEWILRILPLGRTLHVKTGVGGWMGGLTPGLGRVSG